MHNAIYILLLVHCLILLKTIFGNNNINHAIYTINKRSDYITMYAKYMDNI